MSLLLIVLTSILLPASATTPLPTRSCEATLLQDFARADLTFEAADFDGAMNPATLSRLERELSERQRQLGAPPTGTAAATPATLRTRNEQVAERDARTREETEFVRRGSPWTFKIVEEKENDPNGSRAPSPDKTQYVSIPQKRYKTSVLHNMNSQSSFDLIENVEWAYWSPNGKKIITTSNKVLQGATDSLKEVTAVWDSSNGAKLFEIDGVVTTVRWSPDSSMAVISLDERLFLWNLVTGEHAPLFLVNGTIRWGKDGTKFLIRRQLEIIVVTLAGLSPLAISSQTFEKHPDGVATADLSPDGSKIFSADNNGNALIWDSRTGEPITTVDAEKEPFHRSAWSPDGSMVAAIQSKNLLVIDSISGKILSTSPITHGMSIYDLNWGGDGSVISAETFEVYGEWRQLDLEQQ